MSEFPKPNASVPARVFHKVGNWATMKSIDERRAETEVQTQRRGAVVMAIGAGVTGAAVAISGGSALEAGGKAFDRAWDQMTSVDETDSGMKDSYTYREQMDIHGQSVENHNGNVAIQQAAELPSDQVVSVRVL